MLADLLRSLASGFLMGTADLVPGVSGGTIALVLGIYPRLVASIREGSSAIGALVRLDLTRMRGHLGKVEWGLLLPLVAGILTAVVILASFLEHQLAARPTILAAAFFGLVVGSVVVAWKMIRSRVWVHPTLALVVAVVVFATLGAGAAQITGSPSLLGFFGAGALAVCAMILPGISGSLILVLIGMYPAALGAVTARDWPSMLSLAAGAVAGLALFSQVLHWALRRHHDLVVSAMMGLMAGSLRILWPWPEGVQSPALAAPAADWPSALLASVIGVGAVYVITRLAGDHRA